MRQGATQSNHARQTAAFAARLGMGCHILPEARAGYEEPNYTVNGAVLIDHLHGATTETFPGGHDMAGAMERAAEGRRVYTISGGGPSPTGALGHVNCALELVAQANDRELRIDRIVHETGASGTQAGLVAGLAAIHAGSPMLGIGTRAPRERQEAMVHDLAVRTAERIGAAGAVRRERVVANCDSVGEGCGIPTESCLDAIATFAEIEGILLDPVYSARGAAGLIDLIRRGEIGADGERIVFLRTGGAVGRFGHDWAFDRTGRHTEAAASEAAE